ncbi:MAG: SAM-dependent chlorinase/fluorinase [Bryobacteraceae bacterium]|nr:SAM-dependent chlorinase/fluorinase [Bryobacterales bacterium]MEB2362961.1 SAM-dependent chlorinase/fluorinase [Bryobacterales bacterium]NUN01726.1 SAM-dependent chlorinase/fluorinase [Bryobacteraceae bacterium]
MPRSIITLTTDFGASDHFVGTMKGVLLSIAPQAQLVDITHNLNPFEISEGAFVIGQAYRYFPKNTVHLVVIDPGVGTARRPILVQAGGQFFVAPDNGVLSMVYSREKPKVRAVTADKFFLKPVSHTFHGRDVFSPVAAHTARGTPPAAFGKLIKDYLRLDLETPSRTGKRVWTGTILKIDHFGNLITNFRMEEFEDIQTRRFEMAVGTRRLWRLANTYAEVEPGELVLIAGSAGFIEICANQASAAKLLGCGVGAPAELTVY